MRLNTFFSYSNKSATQSSTNSHLVQCVLVSVINNSPCLLRPIVPIIACVRGCLSVWMCDNAILRLSVSLSLLPWIGAVILSTSHLVSAARLSLVLLVVIRSSCIAGSYHSSTGRRWALHRNAQTYWTTTHTGAGGDWMRNDETSPAIRALLTQ